MSKGKGSTSIYCVGRNELIQWVNELLDLSYTKVEDASNGAAFCQVLDAVHPGTVALGRVNYEATNEPEMLNNYKILQDAFDKNGITQHIDVITLTKGKYMATLEMFQWIYGYFQSKQPTEPYDASSRRKKTKCKEPKLSSGQKTAPQRPTPIIASKPKTTVSNKTEPKILPKIRESNNSTTKDSSRKLKELQEEVEQMTQERNFYYNKLRKVEEYCQEKEKNPLIKPILDILYEGDEENGFVVPDESDE